MQSIFDTGFILSCLVLAAVPSVAQKWIPVFEDKLGGVVYIDAESKKTDGGRIEYSGRHNNGAPYRVIAICNPVMRADGELPRRRITPDYFFEPRGGWRRSEVLAACGLPYSPLHAHGQPGSI